MKTIITLFILLSSFNLCLAQNDGIVEVMEDLRLDWDAKVTFLSSFEDLQNICRNRDFRVDLIALLDQIHHYDTTLYYTVTTKYSLNSDPEAKATLDDIETLEADYTTGSFRTFVHEECNEYNFVQNNFGKEGDSYESEKKRVEIEMNKYVRAITWQIDVIDEHAHHLSL